MNKYAKSRTALFLMELIIALLFFSLASAICLQFFVKAHLLSEKTKELNNAVMISQSVAEVMRGSDGDIYSISQVFPYAIEGDESFFEIFYDSNFTACDYDNADVKYACDVTCSPNGAIQNINIRIVRLKDFSEIYSLKATKYMNAPQG